jgi:toxin YoeB
MRKILFEENALKQFHQWEREDKKIFRKILELLDEARKNPFKGTGKPEPLKHQFKGCWSRRINHQHRLIYKVTDEAIVVIACKYHY